MRIYQSISLSPNQTLLLDSDASHHVARVMRASVGDALVLFNGLGGEYQADITRIDKKSVEVRLKSFDPREVESPVSLHLAQGIARGEKMDFIVQKAVELGVTQITPLITERCNVRLDAEREEKRLQHWRAVAISACEQSGRNRLPQIHEPVSLTHWLPTQSSGRRFVLSPHVSAKLPAPASSSDHSPIVVLIGPEGGLSDAEVTLAAQQGFLPLNLGPRILRTETATVTALTVMQCRYGDLVET